MTTTTIVGTVTAEITTTQTNLYTAGTSTATSTQEQTRNLFSNPFTIRNVSRRYGCMIRSLPFTADKGQRIVGEMTSNDTVSFYMMSEQVYHDWDLTKLCAVEPFDTLYKYEFVTRFSFDVVVPETGEYRFLFENYNGERFGGGGVRIDFNARLSSLAIVTITSLRHVTSTESTVYASTQTLTSLRTEQVSQGFAMGQNELLIGAIVAIVVIVGASLAYRSRTRKKPIAAQTSDY